MDRANRTVAFAFLALCMVAVICNIRLVRASGPIYIRADGTVEPIGAPIQRNGDVYILTDNVTSQADGIIIEKSSITLDGSGYTVQGGAGGNGFYLYGISNVTIRNVRTEGFNYGIYLESTSRNVISRNDMRASTYDGIGLYDAANNSVSSNSMRENGWSGIGLYFSMGNNLSANYISNNYYGMNCFSSQENWIFHNNFVANTNQTSSDGLPNAWDNGYPSGGNYWSDYAGSDTYSGVHQNETGSDGIGDTPYDCAESNQDRYPLMQVFTNIAVQRVLPSKSIVGQGYNVTIEVRVENQGWEPKTISITFYVNTTVLATYTNLEMTGRNQTILNATWQTATYTKGNYTTRIVADTVSGEVDITDNNCTWMIHVGVPGDVSSSTQGVYDGIVNMRDIQYMILLFNAKPSSPKWNPNADVNNDLVVNMRDINIAIMNFNKHE